jgi:Alpha/beta hydrolase domain
VAAGDPRLSLAERYQDNEKYVSAVAAAANKLENARFLLDEDKDRIIKRAARDGVDLWVVTAQALP